MSLPHPFYCRCYLAVVLSTTLFFALFEKANWHVLPFFFALIPITCSILFLCIDRLNTLEDNGCSKRFSEFGKNSIFLILFLLMICAGAGEQVIAQWASFFCGERTRRRNAYVCDTRPCRRRRRYPGTARGGRSFRAHERVDWNSDWNDIPRLKSYFAYAVCKVNKGKIARRASKDKLKQSFCAPECGIFVFLKKEFFLAEKPEKTFDNKILFCYNCIALCEARV